MEKKSYYFAFTMRKNSGVKTIKSAIRTFNYYEYYIKGLEKNNNEIIKKIDYYFENKYMGNGRWNLHVHAIIKTNKFKSLPSIKYKYKKGFQILIELCWSKKGWKKYITKSVKYGSKEYILNEIETNIDKVKNNSELKTSTPI